MEESIAEEMPDLPDILIPPVEVNMVVGDEPVHLPDDDTDEIAAIPTATDYKDEMLQSGLELSDFEYLNTAYKNLEDVKFIRIHCTSCDKHVGSAPNDLQNRYEHPLLKVLICGDCFQFYSSGDFEKDEDGSELYCRWCGEGGQVFCCTKCPFVFCKRCIRRNLGRGIAKVIENSDNWMCFSCDKSQINRHRATYWAVQKYSEEMIKRSKITGNSECLSVDENICCSTIKKRQDVYNKLMQPPRKRQKLFTLSTYQTVENIRKPTVSKHKQYQKKAWDPSCIAEEPEDEVICTPDIIPLDESPPRSPEQIEPPEPIIPVVQQETSVPIVPQVPPLYVRAPVSTNMSITDLQKQLQTKYTQIILTPRPRPPIRNHQASFLPVMPRAASQNNGNYRFVINSQPNTTVPNLANTNFVFRPVNPITNNTNVQAPIAAPSKAVEAKDWFDQAAADCAEVTEYMSSKIMSLSGVHTRAYKSEKLMEELHNTFQTYMHVATEKINKLRRIMQSNYERDMEKTFKNAKKINPFAMRKTVHPDTSSDETSQESNSAESSQKTRFVLTKNIEPDEVLFDMDVTNASDEENEEKRGPVTDDKNQENHDKNDVIHIIDSDDEVNENIVSDDVLAKIRVKFNIKNIPSKELIKYLSAVIVVTNKINTEIGEVHTGKIQRNIENKLITQIKKLLEDPIEETSRNTEIKEESGEENREEACEENREEACEENREEACEETRKETREEIREETREEACVESLREIHDEVREEIREEDFKETHDEVREEAREEDCEEFNGFEEKTIQNKEKLLNDSEVETERNKNKNSDDQIKEEQKEITSCEETSSLEENTPQGKENLNDCEVASETNKNNCSDDENKYSCDIEDILGSNVVLKSATSFGDAFSKFVCEKAEESDSSEVDSLKETMEMAEELDIMPDFMNDICNRDNGSLSLPPDSLAELSAAEVEMLMKQKADDANEKKTNSDIVLNSEILALKQMAENCVNSVDVHKASTECRG